MSLIPRDQIGELAAYAMEDCKHNHTESGQIQHRLNLLDVWQIHEGSSVLEIGCGQGTTTSVLAAAVGASGHIDAVDPASPDYGTPWTLGQAQAHLSASEIGTRITWHNVDPLALLCNDVTTKWDYVVLSHCIWYFNTPDVLARILAAVKGRATNLLIAEYALKATKKEAEPHLLAAIARASLEAHNQGSDANIRCLLGPDSIKAYAEHAGWNTVAERVVVPDVRLQDGSWEVGTVNSPEFLADTDKYVHDDRVKMVVKSSREAMTAAVVALHGTQVHTMDVWVAKYT